MTAAPSVVCGLHPVTAPPAGRNLLSGRWVGRRLLSCATVLLALAACGRGAGVGERASDAVATVDSTVGVQRATDTVEALGDTAGRTTAPPTSAAGTTADTADAARASEVSLVPTLDSLRLEVRRLSAMVESSTRSVDSVLALSRVDSAAGAGGTTDSAIAQGGRVLQGAAETAKSYGLRAFWAMIVLILTFFVVQGTAYALNALSERSAERRLFFKRIVPIARIVLWAFAIYFVIRVVFAVDARGLLAAAAAVGVAIGFAAQDILKNIFGGLVIVFDQPFQVGDKIQVGNSYGEVVSIGLRSTRIVTPDDSLVSVPNSQIVDTQVSSANSGALDCQVVTDLYLPGFVDEAEAKRIAYQAAASSKYVYLQKPIVVLVKDEFKETFLTHLKVKAYVLDARYEFVFMSDVTERARAEFRRHGLLTPTDGARAWVNLAGAGDAVEGASAPGDAGGRR